MKSSQFGWTRNCLVPSLLEPNSNTSLDPKQIRAAVQDWLHVA
jgi:hypothetical protein